MIRRVQEKDLYRLICILQGHFGCNGVNVNYDLVKMRELSEKSRSLVYEQGGKIVGWVSAHQPLDQHQHQQRLHIEVLFVEPNWRRKGIATKLMNELISAMDAVKETTLQIYDKDDDDDVSASMLKTFYAKYGFVDIDADDSFGDGFMKRVTTALF